MWGAHPSAPEQTRGSCLILLCLSLCLGAQFRAWHGGEWAEPRDRTGLLPGEYPGSRMQPSIPGLCVYLVIYGFCISERPGDWVGQLTCRGFPLSGRSLKERARGYSGLSDGKRQNVPADPQTPGHLRGREAPSCILPACGSSQCCPHLRTHNIRMHRAIAPSECTQETMCNTYIRQD